MTKTRDLADLGGGFIQVGSGAVQRTVESKLQDVVSVKDFGAVGNGVTDDTAAIQAALNAAIGYAGKGDVYLPRGKYKITSRISIPQGVTLRGAGGITNNRFQRDGTVLEENTSRIYVTFGSGIDDSSLTTYANNAAVLLNSGSGIESVSFWYPSQSYALVNIGDSPTVYPPAIITAEDCQNAAIKQIHLGNSFIGIDATTASTNLVLDDIRGLPCGVGIKLGGSVDPAQISNIKFTLQEGWDLDDPYSDPEMRYYLHNNAVAIDLRRATWTVITNSFFYGYNKGVWLTETVTDGRGGTTGPSTNCSISGCGFDNCKYGIYGEPNSTYDVGFISIVNCRFAQGSTTLTTGDVLVPEYNIKIETTYSKPDFTISSCKFSTATKDHVYLLGAKRSVITGNVFYSAGSIYNGTTYAGPYYNIRIRDCDQSVVSSNVIQAQGGTARGVSVEYATAVAITGNQFIDLVLDPIYLLESDRCVIESNIGTNNTLPLIAYNSLASHRDVYVGTNPSGTAVFGASDVDGSGLLNIPLGTRIAFVDVLPTVNGITAGTRGTQLIIRVGATGNTFTDQDAGTAQPNRLYLAGNFAANFGDTLHLVSGADGGWYEVSRSSN